MRILHIANFSWFSSKRKRANNLARYYTTDRKITNGLIRNGHCLWDFSYRDTARYCSPLGMEKKLGAQKMNDYLIRLARQFKPDLILLGHCEIITETALRTLRDCLPDVKIAQWWVDPFADHLLPAFTSKITLLGRFNGKYKCGFFGFDNAPALNGYELSATIGKSKIGSISVAPLIFRSTHPTDWRN